MTVITAAITVITMAMTVITSEITVITMAMTEKRKCCYKHVNMLLIHLMIIC